MSLDRTILHCDLNGFFASVECLLNPQLKDVPMAVAGNHENRHGIILVKNELAKKYKIQTAETIWQAKKKCPELVLVPPRHGVYEKYSKLVNEIYNDFTDLVEPFGIDESWLDVTGVRHILGDGKEIADKIRAVIRENIGLTVSVGVSFNKIFAKLGNDYKKPDATTVINRENYKDIVFPLPVTDLLFVGRGAKATVDKFNIKTIGELANSDKNILKSRLGKEESLKNLSENEKQNDKYVSLVKQIQSKGINNQSLSLLFKKIVIFDAHEITLTMKEEYGLCDDEFQYLYESGGVVFIQNFIFTATVYIENIA